MKKFEYFEATADIGFKAYGKTMNEAFENAGLAIFNIISDTDEEYHLKLPRKTTYPFYMTIWKSFCSTMKRNSCCSASLRLKSMKSST